MNFNDGNAKISLIIPQGMYKTESILSLLEIFVQHFLPALLSIIIPFALIVIELFTPALSFIQFNFQNSFGIIPTVDSVARSDFKVLKKLIPSNSNFTFGIRQGTGGYLVKLLAASVLPINAISYNSMSLFYTYSSVFNEIVDKKGKVSYDVINAVFSNSTFSRHDRVFKENIGFPNIIKKPLTSSFEDACLVAATCDFKYKYAGFCEQVFGQTEGNDYKEHIIKPIIEELKYKE